MSKVAFILVFSNYLYSEFLFFGVYIYFTFIVPGMFILLIFEIVLFNYSAIDIALDIYIPVAFKPM
jgi:hypothetical protein